MIKKTFFIYFLDLGVQTKTGSDPSKKSELDMQATKYIVICHMISIVIKWIVKHGYE